MGEREQMDPFGEIIKRLDNLQRDLDLVKEKLEVIEGQTGKMEGHINFVEEVYQRVQDPFHFMCRKVSQLMGNETKSLKDTNG